MKRIGFVIIVILFLTALYAEEIVIDQGGFNIELISSDDSKTVIDFSFGSFRRFPVEIEGKEFYHIALQNEPVMLEEGYPALPYLSRSIIIPAFALKDVRVLAEEYTDYQMKVVPSKGALYRYQNPDEIPYTFAEQYRKDTFFPGHLTELGEPYIIRDFRGQTVRINPFQYNPVSGVLRVYHKLTVEVTSIGSDIRNVNPQQNDSYTREFETIYQNRFLNFSRQRYTPLEDQGRMIVIAFDAFVDATMPYVNWKNQKGIPTTIHPLSTIGSTATAIKNFIQAQYDQDDGLVFVQIVGDAPQVPPMIHGSIASDPSFSLLAGNDAYGDIFVGRFSAENVAQLTTQIERTIHYERDITVSDTWLANAMNVAYNGGPGHGGLYDDEHSELVRQMLLNYTYVHGDAIYAPNASAAMVTNAVNAGRGIANYTGHGSTTSWSTTGFSNTHVNALTNDNMLPFIISVACVNGNFASTTCYAEAWLRATNNTTGNPTGAIAMYASSRNQLWYPPMSAQIEIANLLVTDQKNTIGGLFFNGSFQMIDDYPLQNQGPNEFLYWHIFGDASLQVRSAAPQTMNVTYNSSLPVGVNTLQVSTGNENALVSLTNSEYEILAYGYTNSAGTVTLNIADPPTQPQTLNLTVTAYNRVTYTGSVQVTAAGGPFIVLNSHSLSGDGAHTPQFDELIDIEITLENVGLDPAHDVAAVLSSSSGGVTIIDDQDIIGTIPASSSVTRPNAFLIQTANNLSDQTTLDFSILISSGFDNWTADFSFNVNAPILDTNYPVVQDPPPGGNNNGFLDPGETVTMIFSIENTGQASSPVGVAVLDVDNPLVTIVDPLNNLSVIAPSSSANTSYTVSLDPGIIPGTVLDFTITVDYGEYSLEQSYSMPVGLVAIEIGTGTGSNATSGAAPVNIYFRSLRGQMVYTAAEINAAGFTGPGFITDLGFYVTQSPIYNLPNFIIRMKHTTATNAASHDTGPFQTVYTTVTYAPQAGDWDMLELSEPFEWNGVDNILVDTAFGIVSPGWNSSGQQRIFDSPTGFRYSRSDSADQTNATTSLTTGYKPQIRFVFTGQGTPPQLLPPSGLVAVAGDEIVDLTWDAPGARERDRQNEIAELLRNLTGYNIYRDGEFLASTSSDVTNYSDTDVVNETTYSYYVTAQYTEGESEPSGTVIATPNAFNIIWEESFSSTPTGWTLEGNWSHQTGYIRLYWEPAVTDFDMSAISPNIQLPNNVGDLVVNQLYNDYSAVDETLEIIIVHQGGETILWSYLTTNGSFGADDFVFPLQAYAGQTIQLKFRGHGSSTWNIDWWNIYNVSISGEAGEPTYGVAVNPETATNSGHSNTFVDYVITVTNTGNIADNYSLSAGGNLWNVSFLEQQRFEEETDIPVIELPDGTVYMEKTPAPLRNLITETGTIQAGNSKDILVRVAIPSGAFGSDTALIDIISQGDTEVSATVTIETVSLGFDPTLPVEPRYIAEWEPMQGVLIRYPLGIPYALISEFSNHTTVYTIVSSGSLNAAMTNYQNNNVNMENCVFIEAPSNSYWTRDYGPWSIATAEGIGIADFSYDRPRPNDNNIPSVLRDFFNIPYHLMPITHTGGNMMGDGMGVGASTDLILESNPSLTAAQIDQIMYSYLGIDNYYKRPHPSGDTLMHIDTWAKFLDVDKIMIRSVHTGHSQYNQIEAAADFFANQTSPYGTPYQVYRVYTPNNEPYCNSLIVNNKVFVPITGSANDNAALVSYQQAMPGYEILGFTGSWLSNDALHCRVMGLADQGMLYVSHTPPLTNYSNTDITIDVTIRAYSRAPLVNDSLNVYWRTSPDNDYMAAPLIHYTENIFKADIPGQEFGENIYYYISAADESGRVAYRPAIGEADPFVIEINAELAAPDIIEVTIENNLFSISWEMIPGATGYLVETSNDVNGEFSDATETGTFTEEGNIITWQTEVSNPYRLYRVKAYLGADLPVRHLSGEVERRRTERN